jgi:muramoyltetrapeptide carboxypeptidase LdcA involved in peptidoglycan recycling
MTWLSSMPVIKPKAPNIFIIKNREGGVCCHRSVYWLHYKIEKKQNKILVGYRL